MSKYERPTWKALQFGLYFLTAIALAYSGYKHLDFITHGIENVKFSDLIEAWPIFSLFASSPLLITGAFLSIQRPPLAAKLALVASVIGWGYIIIMGCAACLTLSILVFLPDVFFAYFAPVIPLFVTTIYSYRVTRSTTAT